MSKVFVGTSGYLYRHWADDVFYPKDLKTNEWLQYYCQFFKTVELNVTFYRLPTKEAFRGWFKKTPADFHFAIKGSRFITHIKRLKDADRPLKLFLNRASGLKEKLDVVLWQLPPKFKVDIERLNKFIRALSRYKRFRYAFEFRDETWLIQKVFCVLADFNIALCIADWPSFSIELPQTANFLYLRRHGTGAWLYSGNYSVAQLKGDATRIRGWLKEGKDVYIYFNNDARGYAPKNARTLLDILRD